MSQSFLRLCVYACVVTLARAYEAIPYPTCTSEEYFDISSLNCGVCPTDQKPDELQTSCECSAPRLRQGDLCVACSAAGFPADYAATRDGSTCLSCSAPPLNDTTYMGEATLGLCNGTLFNEETPTSCAYSGECSCPTSQVVVERDELGGLLPYKQCRACPTGSYFVAASASAAASCVACPAENMVAIGEGATGCTCATGFKERSFTSSGTVGWWGREKTCMEKVAYTAVQPFDTASATQVRFDALTAGGSYTVDSSKIFDQLLIPSATECYRAVTEGADKDLSLLAGNQACQAVGNLCVLQQYNSATGACEL